MVMSFKLMNQLMRDFFKDCQTIFFLYGDFFQIGPTNQIPRNVHHESNVNEITLGEVGVHSVSCENQQNVACRDGMPTDRCRYNMPSERQ